MLTEVDHHDHEALAALDAETGDGAVQEIDVCLPLADGEGIGEALRAAARGDVTTA